MSEEYSTVGIVSIGRNEGERLAESLASAAIERCPVVYVDSGSSDGSVAHARSVGVEVVELDMSQRFSAARARNAGFSRMAELNPDLKYVQFIDGDCILVEGWLPKAVDFLNKHSDYAVVCGRRRERFPDASVYNRLIDMEWDTPVGNAKSCGGDSMMRVKAFAHVGGFDPDVVAGEEPELCARLHAAGWRVMRLAEDMTCHDAAMKCFLQWWKRSVRSGYGGLCTFQRCEGGSIRPFASQIRSARFWAIVWPTAILSAALTGGLFAGTLGATIAFTLTIAVVPLQILRIALRQKRRGVSSADAFLYAAFMMLSKVPQILGQIRWLVEQRRGIAATLVEYK